MSQRLPDRALCTFAEPAKRRATWGQAGPEKMLMTTQPAVLQLRRSTDSPAHLRSEPNLSAGLPESHGEVSYEKTAVRCGAVGVRNTVCPKPVRWDLDDKTGHSQVSHQARQILAE